MNHVVTALQMPAQLYRYWIIKLGEEAYLRKFLYVKHPMYNSTILMQKDWPIICWWHQQTNKKKAENQDSCAENQQWRFFLLVGFYPSIQVLYSVILVL